ncbi:conserved Plasmodium protein, unknown function [Plasmodium vivax]|uniref:Uncharacterized protein n=1 Tax=Plasmodium vivax TaxID=5855 RepID=A0A565A3B2_PLAVI|nr:conserved Plasmodium protein, unknown function [Plasmodium vivax]
MNGQAKSGQGRRASPTRVERATDGEAEKKEFCLFYICELLNVIYSTYKSGKPMYVHFVCSKEQGGDSEGESEREGGTGEGGRGGSGRSGSGSKGESGRSGSGSKGESGRSGRGSKGESGRSGSGSKGESGRSGSGSKHEDTNTDEGTHKRDGARTRGGRNAAGRNGFHYTPKSVLEQYFPDHFKDVHFLCAHYAMWANQPSGGDSRGDSPPRANSNDAASKQKRRGFTESGAEQANAAYRKEEETMTTTTTTNTTNTTTFYFIFTFYMQPNFLWEEINIPIFHDRGYIECRFECVSNLMKLTDVGNLAARVKLGTSNQTLIQCIRGGEGSAYEGVLNGGNPDRDLLNGGLLNGGLLNGGLLNGGLLNGGNADRSLPNGGNPDRSLLNGANSTNRRRGDVHLLPFFISSHFLRKNCQVCLTRVISFNDRGVYCKRDQGDDLPVQLLLLVRKRLYKRLKSIEREAALVCHLRRSETKGGNYPRGDYPKGEYPKGDSAKFLLPKEGPRKKSSDISASIRSDENSDGAARTSGSRRGDLQVDRPKGKHARDNLAGVDYDEIQKLISCAETIFKRKISDQQLEKLLLRMRSRRNSQGEATRGRLSHLASAANLANIANFSNVAKVANLSSAANLANLANLATPEGGLSPSRGNFPTDEAMDGHLGLDDYYEFVRSSKSELKNTLRDPWQLGIDVNKTSKKNKFV